MIKRLLYCLFIISIFSCSEAQTIHKKKLLKTTIGTIKFDEAITGFKFATMLGNKFLYSPNGKKDLSNTYKTSGYYISAVPNIDYVNVRGYLQDFSEGFSEQQDILKSGEKTIKVYNTVYGKATIITFRVTYKANENGIAFHAIVSNGKDAIIFISEDHDNGKFIDKFKKTFESIEK